MMAAGRRRACLITGALGVCILLSACARVPVPSSQLARLPVPPAVELTDTPFFPQRDYQCGPAALATVLNARGVPVSPEQLQPLVYLPARKGSLQSEMLVTPARFGRLGVRITGKLESLLLELAAGRPVLVLQNLGRSWLPVWHYAVVIGYDLDAKQVYLRSGTRKRRVYALRRFVDSWQRAGYWAMVVVAPGTVPETVNRTDFLQAVTGLERQQHHAAALAAYTAATQRWPDDALAWAGLGNAAFAQGDLGPAERAYRRALTVRPAAPLILNNLALALAKQGCVDTALSAIGCALALRPDDTALVATRAEIVALPPGGRSCEPVQCPSLTE
jgi:hypothetical protein